MTEKLTVEDGRLKVERIEGKQSLDLDLSAVDEVYFERSPDPAYPGALILVTGHSADVVRVDNDEAGSVMEQVWPVVNAARAERSERAESPAPSGNVDESEEPKDGTPTDSTTPANARRTRRASQTA